MNYTFNTIIGVAAGVLGYVFGAPDAWLIGLIILVIADYITGLMKAFIAGELSSKVGFKGILKKIMYFAIVAVAVLIDNLTGAEGVLRIACIGFLIANEGVSILENCAAAGLPVPQALIKVLNKLKDEDEPETE